jgi:hypothetical protein
MVLIKATIETPTGTMVARVNPIRPSWAGVYRGYPLTASGAEIEAENVFRSLFGDNYDPSYKNACASRVSIALLNAGVTIDEGTRVTHGALAGKRVILGASDMNDWLIRKWGKADFSVSQPRSEKDLQAKFLNKKGVYVMIPHYPSRFGATGHCTLWTGQDVIGHHYANDSAYAAYLWELK